MNTAIYLDPLAIEQAIPDEKGWINYLGKLIDAVRSNMILFFDEDSRDLSIFKNRLYDLLSHPAGQRARIKFTEILKDKKQKNRLRCFPTLHGQIKNPIFIENQLPEALVITENGKEPSHLQDKIVIFRSLIQYLDSDVEENRLSYSNTISPSSIEEFGSIFRKATRYSKDLSFYDPYAGRGINAKKYYKSIKLLLDIWLKSCQDCSKKMTIYSVFEENQFNSKVGKNLPFEKIKILLTEDLLNPIKENYGVSVSVKMKKFEHTEDHDRFFETDTGFFGMTRGFDILTDGGGLKNFSIYHPDKIKIAHLAANWRLNCQDKFTISNSDIT
jgi:hypothetical protein